MTLHIERARTRRPITWLTLIGVLLLPVLIGGILVAALYNPAERLDNMSAAIVNEDEPVTIDDQLVPLGPPAHRRAGRRLRRDRQQPRLDDLERRRRRRGPRRRHLPGGRHDPRELLRGRDLDRAGRHPRAGDDRGVDAARLEGRRRRHHRAGDLGRGIHHGHAAVAGVPRERLPRVHDARRPARRSGRRAHTSSPTARSRRPTARRSFRAARRSSAPAPRSSRRGRGHSPRDSTRSRRARPRRRAAPASSPTGSTPRPPR